MRLLLENNIEYMDMKKTFDVKVFFLFSDFRNDTAKNVYHDMMFL